MKFNFQQAVRAMILLLFLLLIYNLHSSGDITKYINPKYEMLSKAAGLIFLALFLVQLTRVWTSKGIQNKHCCHNEESSCHHHHDHGDGKMSIKKLCSYAIIVFPILTGFLLPAKALDSSIAEKKGGMMVLSKKQDSTQLVSPDESKNQEEIADIQELEHSSSVSEPKEMSKDDFDKIVARLNKMPTIEMNAPVFSTYYDYISSEVDKYVGRSIQLKGFVYKEDGLLDDQLVISRFLVTHCAADAGIIGFLSQFEDAPSLKKDTWIEAEGIIDITTYNEVSIPLIKVTKWKEINEPDEPYIYPISVKLK